MNKKNKKLVIVNQDVGYLFVDLANAALEHYDEVVLVSGSIVELGSRLDKRVQIRSMVRYRRKSVLSRFTSWVLGFLQVVWLLRTRFHAHEAVVASNPPLNTLLPLLVRNKMGLYVLDMYPEALYKTGMVSSKSLVVRAWKRLNRVAYRRFNAIWALTPSMKTAIEQEYNVETEFVPAWASNMDAGQDKSFLERVGLTHAWVVLYSGNLGREHDVETLLDCAEALTDHDDVLFVIAGQGWKRAAIEQRVRQNQLDNVRLLPKLPATEFTTLLRHAQIGVVSQSLRTADVCIPSKTFNLLAVGLPILGIGKPDSDFGRLVIGRSAGRVFTPVEVDPIVQFLMACRRDAAYRQRMAENALSTSHDFTRLNAENLVKQFSDKLPSI